MLFIPYFCLTKFESSSIFVPILLNPMIIAKRITKLPTDKIRPRLFGWLCEKDGFELILCLDLPWCERGFSESERQVMKDYR